MILIDNIKLRVIGNKAERTFTIKVYKTDGSIENVFRTIKFDALKFLRLMKYDVKDWEYFLESNFKEYYTVR